MIITVDIGNSNIVIGLFKENILLKATRLTTMQDKTEDEYISVFNNLFYGDLKIKNNEIEGIIVSSVVPNISFLLISALKSIFNKDALLLAPGIKTGLLIKTDDPSEVGADLVCGAVGIIKKYPVPAILIDLGTATKFVIIDENKALIGATIVPGLKISVDALIQRASQLPKISLIAPALPYGKNTADSMNAGAIYGTASMIDGMIERISASLNKKFSVIITGGMSKYVAGYCKSKITFDENIVLDGLQQIYIKNLK